MGKGKGKKRSKKRAGKGKINSTVAMLELGDLRELLESALFLTNLGVKKVSKKKRKKMEEEEIEDSIGPHAVSHPLLTTLMSARNALDESQMVVDSLVMSLRSDGVTWPQVGEALGVSAHAAQQRFGRRVKMRNISY
jgi:site-specific recombinase XerC